MPKIRTRRKKVEKSKAVEAGGDQIAFLDVLNKGKLKKREAKKKSAIELTIEDAERRSKSGDWGGATGKTFVGLFALCHRIEHRFVPLELSERTTMTFAAKLAASCLHTHFNDDPSEMVDFVVWCWERERGLENWALQNGRNRDAINVRSLFSASMVTKYRIDQSRSKKRASNGRR